MKSRSKNKQGSWFTVLLVIAAAGLWAYNELQPSGGAARSSDRPKAERNSDRNSSPPPSTPGSRAGKASKVGAYEFYQKAKLVEARNNDGDSFMVSLPDGRTNEFRLYFVDTPESAFKTYRGGENNHKRIADQAADMGGITFQQAVTIGKEAKSFVLGLLGNGPFNIYTSWDSPFRDNRFHAFVEVQFEGKPRWLHELLVEKGLVRIHTKGAPLPDGTSLNSHKAKLRSLESSAKRAAKGAWGL